MWASGSFDGADATISYGQPDAIRVTGGDSTASQSFEAWLAHFDHDGNLLGVASVTGDGNEEGLALAPRPTGGVDWEVTAVAGDPITDLAGGITPFAAAGGTALVRFGVTGALEAQLPLDPNDLGATTYVGSDLVAMLSAWSLPATLPAWGGAPRVGVSGYPAYQQGYSAFVTWPAGAGAPLADIVAWFSGSGLKTWAGAGGRAVAGEASVNTLYFFPETFHLKVQHDVTYENPLGNFHVFAVAEDPSGTFGCGVDVHTDAATSSLGFVMAVALDEAGGLWMAGSAYHETLSFTKPDGTLNTQIVAANDEESQGWMARWQLWPGTAPTETGTTP